MAPHSSTLAWKIPWTEYWSGVPLPSPMYRQRSEECKEIEENNRMGKTRDLFKRIRDTKGTFHSKMGTIKDRNIWT